MTALYRSHAAGGELQWSADLKLCLPFLQRTLACRRGCCGH